MNQTSEIYDDALVNWDRDRTTFMLFIDVVCGFDASSELYHALDRTVHNEVDVDHWAGFFDGDFNTIEDTTNAYLESLELDIQV